MLQKNSAFHPPPHAGEAEADLHLLCPVRALAIV